MHYADRLKKMISEAPPATGLFREQIEKGIAAISARLKEPLGDAERLMLCADRASLRKSLERLPSISGVAP